MRQEIIAKLDKALNRGYTITEIARQLGMSQSYLWHIYHGTRVGSVGTLERIEAWIPKPYKRTRRTK